jgi:hypothetical protein
MFRFYVSTKDDARQCNVSFDEQLPITVNKAPITIPEASVGDACWFNEGAWEPALRSLTAEFP